MDGTETDLARRGISEATTVADSERRVKRTRRQADDQSVARSVGLVATCLVRECLGSPGLDFCVAKAPAKRHGWSRSRIDVSGRCGPSFGGIMSVSSSSLAAGR